MHRCWPGERSTCASFEAPSTRTAVLLSILTRLILLPWLFLTLPHFNSHGRLFHFHLFCQQHLSSVGKNGAQMCCVSVNFHFKLPSSLIRLVSHYTEASSVLSHPMLQHRASSMLHRHDHPWPIILHSEGVPAPLASPCSSVVRLAVAHRCPQVNNEASQALERKRWKRD